MPELKPISRPAARVLVIDSDDRLLLIRAVLPPESPIESKPGVTYDRHRVLWLTPGGGLDYGESHEEAAARELWEETGISGVDLGPQVWRRTHVFVWNNALWEQQEQYFVVRVDKREVHMDFATPDEMTLLTELRWWTLDDIVDSAETFVPSGLGALLPPILAGDYPSTPIDAGG